MPVILIHRLEVVDVYDKHGDRLAADSGDPDAEATMTRFKDRLARALATVINILDPAAVVLGGGLSGIQRFFGNVPALLPEYVFPIRYRRHCSRPNMAIQAEFAGLHGYGRSIPEANQRERHRY